MNKNVKRFADIVAEIAKVSDPWITHLHLMNNAEPACECRFCGHRAFWAERYNHNDHPNCPWNDARRLMVQIGMNIEEELQDTRTTNLLTIARSALLSGAAIEPAKKADCGELWHEQAEVCAWCGGPEIDSDVTEEEEELYGYEGKRFFHDPNNCPYPFLAQTGAMLERFEEVNSDEDNGIRRDNDDRSRAGDESQDSESGR